MGMTIDGAIAHAREVAKRRMAEYENHYDKDGHYYPMQCKKCAEEHIQLAEWLEELKQYRAIRTVEECRAAMEKQTAKKGIREEIKKGYNRGMHHYYCPVCYEKGDLRNKYNVGSYCSDCGQKLDWSDKE